MGKRKKITPKQYSYSFFYKLVVALIIVLVILVVPRVFAQTSSIVGIQPGAVIENDGTTLLTDGVADQLSQTGATYIRINFRLGPYDSDTDGFYETYDAVVNRLVNKGFTIIGLLSNESVSGNQEEWNENNWEHTGGDGYNAYIDRFGYQFVRIAKHYEGKIYYWEIWNEPNAWTENPSPQVYSGGTFMYPSNFAALLTHCHSQANFYNKIDVKLISGGVFGHDISGFTSRNAGAEYLIEVYKTGIEKTGKFAWTKNTYGNYPLDAVGQHIYISQGEDVHESELSNYLDYIHDAVNQFETDQKPTFVTEFGWSTKYVSPEVQSKNLENAFSILKQKSFVQSAIWFQLQDSPGADLFFGVLDENGEKKESWNAFSNESNNILAAAQKLLHSIRTFFHVS